MEDKKAKGRKWIGIFLGCMLGVMIGTTLMQGLPILGMPKQDEVVGAILEIDGKVQEISQEDLGLSVLIARGLRCWGPVSEQQPPDTMITYQMKDGSSIVVGADENIIYKDGKFYRSKKDCGAFFETVAQGIFDGWH